MNKITTDNIFEDLGFPPEEAAVLNRKAELMGELRKFIQSRRFNNLQAAKKLGVSRSAIADLKSGNMDSFSIDMLIGMLEHIGTTVTFVLSAKNRTSAA